jgi:hypothetical protein
MVSLQEQTDRCSVRTKNWGVTGSASAIRELDRQSALAEPVAHIPNHQLKQDTCVNLIRMRGSSTMRHQRRTYRYENDDPVGHGVAMTHQIQRALHLVGH